ncbi:MAG: hypothetical protein DRR19_18755 [Candidatus Parabeggiatoa sp. nov. 1]|nr:MAG: hypothetical protein DRR19_18755 [Gammaproteobacteria bacterium]
MSKLFFDSLFDFLSSDLVKLSKLGNETRLFVFQAIFLVLILTYFGGNLIFLSLIINRLLKILNPET